MRTRLTYAAGHILTPPWVDTLVTKILDVFPTAPAAAELTAHIAAILDAAPGDDAPDRHPRSGLPRRWPGAPLPDLAALARLLDLDTGELGWFADTRSLERGSGETLRHYHWRALPKRGGVRLVAAPKPRLKEIQRRVLRHLLQPIPMHGAAHGGVPGRSVRTAVTPHAGSVVVIRADIESFFAMIAAGRVFGVLRSAGLRGPVAYDVTGLCTTVIPRRVWRGVAPPADPARLAAHWRLGAALAVPHLPPGAPTSCALANLIAFSLDRRLAGLAAGFGARYTRYVDDLTFSGGKRLRSARSAFVGLVDDIVAGEGFRLAEHKTVVLGDAGRQQVLGAVVNDHPTIGRRERDNLRALLHNCAVHGWRSQARDHAEFRAYLLGRVSNVAALDPPLGAQLRAMYARISWETD
jgi:RNA-directed DNA polymerase